MTSFEIGGLKDCYQAMIGQGLYKKYINRAKSISTEHLAALVRRPGRPAVVAERFLETVIDDRLCIRFIV